MRILLLDYWNRNDMTHDMIDPSEVRPDTAKTMKKHLTNPSFLDIIQVGE